MKQSIMKTGCSINTTNRSKLFALITHLLPHGPAFGTQVVAQVDRMDGRTRFLVKRGFLADPVEDMPVQGAIIIQAGLRDTE